MAGTPKLLAPPAFIGTAAANVFTPAASTITSVITHIHVANNNAATRTFSIYLGATGGSAAGTELVKLLTLSAQGVIGSMWDWYGQMATSSTQFLTAIAVGDATSVIIWVEGYQIVV